ncbi:MAG: family 78 glycoside hydrolase catalytic domain [Tepidisphaerales bacterium]
MSEAPPSASATFLAGPHRLRVEYLTDPLGLDELRPRLSWELRDPRPGAMQTAYQLEFSDGTGKLVHDTGKVVSGQSTQVVYDGPALSWRQRRVWRVRVWDAAGEAGPWSAPAFFETGIGGDFGEAKWIGSTDAGGPRTSSPPPYLRKPFVLPASPLRARLYVTALGVYEARINGRKVGQDELTSGWSDYRKTVYYQTYDVTALLAKGENVLGAILGDGWYCGSVEWRGRQFYGPRPMLLARLEVTCSDGSSHVVVSDGSWHAGKGEILESDLQHGEAIDLRRVQPGWDCPGFKAEPAASWLPVSVYTPAHGRLVGQAHEPVRVTEVLKPVATFVRPGWPQPSHVLDFGQNLVGKLRIRLKGEPGTTVRVRYAEMLKHGPATRPGEEDIYVENLRTARQTDYFTLGESGEGVFETRFTFHGFRYAEVRPWPGKLLEHEAQALVMHSGYESAGEFECADPLVNRLQQNVRWGWRGNSVDIPTDCPQRDERLGWTGDAQVFVRTSMFNFDVAAFWSKWAQDVADAQDAKGGVPATCPSTDILSADGGPAWADAALICPHTLYLCYGDTRLLERFYGTFKRFVAFLDETSRDGRRGLEGTGSWGGFGDWLSINADTPKELIGTAFYAHAHGLLSDIARVLGNAADAEAHANKRQWVAERFRHHYVTPSGRMMAQTQTAALLALHFNLLLPEQRKTVLADLVADIRRRGTKLSCGFVGSPYLNHVLSREGELTLAYELMLQKQWPSWLYAVTQGATTIWERWDGWTHDKGFQDPGMNSFNHYAYGAVGDWLYRVVAGLDAAEPGYRRLRLAPHPPPPTAPAHVRTAFSRARARHRTPYGWAECGWEVAGETLKVRGVVPPNSTAELLLPAPDGRPGKAEALSAGPFEREVNWKG